MVSIVTTTTTISDDRLLLLKRAKCNKSIGMMPNWPMRWIGSRCSCGLRFQGQSRVWHDGRGVLVLKSGGIYFHIFRIFDRNWFFPGKWRKNISTCDVIFGQVLILWREAIGKIDRRSLFLILSIESNNKLLPLIVDFRSWMDQKIIHILSSECKLDNELWPQLIQWMAEWFNEPRSVTSTTEDHLLLSNLKINFCNNQSTNQLVGLMVCINNLINSDAHSQNVIKLINDSINPFDLDISMVTTNLSTFNFWPAMPETTSSCPKWLEWASESIKWYKF